MSLNSQFDVLILGGGFSGTMLAVHLLRRSSTVSVAVMDRGPLAARGLAYSTPHKFHLLNVPAGEMSAFADVPDDFLRWARIHFDAGVRERSFLPRSVYGAYLGDILEKTRLEEGRGRLCWLQDEAISLRRRGQGLAAQTKQGTEVLARVVVLATGNFPPANPHIAGLQASSPAYFQFPWSQEALENLRSIDNVLLLGSGLTSVDFIMALKSKGFRRTIHVLSRKGLFPRARRQVRPIEPWPVFWNEKSARTARGLLRLMRSQVNAASEKGIDWRAVIDSLRPVTPSVWRSLPVEERQRFIRHVRVFWDVHRHRVAPEISDLLDDMRAEGQVCLHSGVLTQYTNHHDGAEIRYWDRETRSEVTLCVARVINCTGSEADCRRIDDPLITSLFVQGLARPDTLFLGLDMNERGILIDSQGNPSRFLFGIGPVRKATLWETTTVSEIRHQAPDLAEHLLQHFEDSGRHPNNFRAAV